MSRYIDADKACLQCIAHHMCNTENCIVAQQPTADVVEVKHGKWIKIAEICGIELLRCSECEYEAPQRHTNYCPHCGAKMDGAQK